MINLALALPLCLFLTSCNLMPDSSASRIIVRTGASPETAEVHILKVNSRYVANGENIDEAQVVTFLAAVEARSEGPASLADLGITQDWLDQNANPAFEELFNGRTNLILPSQKELFLSHFRDLNEMQTAAASYFDSSWTDDFPEVHIEIYGRTRRHGTVLESSDIHSFMIPWSITRDGQTRISYDPNIGLTLGALLPDKAAQKDRIAGTYFRIDLASSLLRQICSKWESLDNRRLYPFINERFGIFLPCNLISTE